MQQQRPGTAKISILKLQKTTLKKKKKRAEDSCPPPDFSLQSTPTEKAPYVSLNLHSCPFSFLLHQPFLSSLTGSVNEPSSRGLRNGEHVCKLAQTLQGKQPVADVSHGTKNTHRKGLRSKGQRALAPSPRANSSPGTSPNFLSAPFMQLLRPETLSPILNNHIFLRERIQRLA